MFKRTLNPPSSLRRLFEGLAACLIVTTFAACNRDSDSSNRVQSDPPTPNRTLPKTPVDVAAVEPPRRTLFTRLSSKQTGISFVNRIDKDHDLSRLYISGFASGGIAIGDVDGDGLADVYFTSGPDANRLFRQVSHFRFEDITEKAGVAANDTWSAGAAFADIDNDGDLDLHVCSYDSPNKLYLNDGRGVFTDVAADSDAAISDASVMAHFCDYDGDGDLDYFLLTNRLYRAGGLPNGKITENVAGKPVLLPEYRPYYHLVQVGPNQFTVKTSGRPNRLLENDGHGNFKDVSKQVGLRESGKGLSAVWYDYDLDGRMDIYVANDFDDPDHLYRNNGDGTFTDVIRNVVPHTTWFSMGSDSADLNNDGLLDLMVLDMSATTHYRQKVTMGDMSARQHFMDHSNPRQLMRNAVFLNPGVGRFMEAAHLSGLASSDWSWAVKLADFDNDGWNDAFVTNGMTTDMTNADKGLDRSRLVGTEEWQLVKDDPPQRDKNLAFRNSGNLSFQPTAELWGLAHDGMSYAAAYGDLDRDGDLDLITTNLDEQIHVYRNESTDNGLTLSLKGTKSNRLGIGAKVYVTQGESEQVRALNPMTGFMSSNEPILHFGLGDASQVDRVTVEWPSGRTQNVSALSAGYHEIIEDVSGAIVERKQTPLIFGYSDELQTIVHREAPFDDFAVQPLLPNKLSQLGPGIAIADVNSDGTDDVFVGAATGTASIQLRGPKGLTQITTDQGAPQREDFAPLFFDADKDGDVDLYVVSGGVEAGNDHALLRDRLYLNDGAGDFELARDALPDSTSISGSVVAAADYDRDGDLDLFVGGRVVPGSYPLGPGCLLLANESSGPNAKFVDVTASISPSMKSTGMVTSALWADVNSDGWIDLLVTTEWGPIRTFLNDEGVLSESTDRSGISDHLGWWNGIAARDFDSDGDIDLVATNFGRNTKYHPTVAHPSRIYFGKFGNESERHIVEAKVGDEHILPIRGKSCSQNAMPFVREKFGTYHDFAQASLGDIYSDAGLNDAQLFEANTLDSAIFLNDGEGVFRKKPLPTLAQISPGFGVVATEINGDGNADIYLVQNFYHPQRETGKMAGGMSVLLYGDGQGNFQEIWPKESGLAVAADAKGLATCDLNDDGWVDLAITINSGPTLAFHNRNDSISQNQSIRIRLSGVVGNPTAIGARVTVETENGSKQTDEVRAGGSYLSQSSPDLFFGCSKNDKIKAITVRWPDGLESEHSPVEKSTKILIEQTR